MSKKTFLMRNYGMSEEQAEQEIQEINKENAEKPMPKMTALDQAMTSFDEDEGD